MDSEASASTVHGVLSSNLQNDKPADHIDILPINNTSGAREDDKITKHSLKEDPKPLSKPPKLHAKKLSIEEIQKPRVTERRRSSIPKFSHEESFGTDPALFVCHDGTFHAPDDASEVLVVSDPIENDDENLDINSSDMVVSESTIMFFDPSTVEDSITPITDFNPLNSENAFDVTIEAVDAKTGEVIEAARISDSSNDIDFLETFMAFEDDNVFENASIVSSSDKNLSKAGQELSKKNSGLSSSEMQELFTIPEKQSEVAETLNDEDEKLSENSNVVLEASPIAITPEFIKSSAPEEIEICDKPPRPPSMSKKHSDQDDLSSEQSPKKLEHYESLDPSSIPSTSNSLSIDTPPSHISLDNNLVVSSPENVAPPLPPPPKQSTLKGPKVAADQSLPTTSTDCSVDLPRVHQTLTIWPQQFKPLPGLLVSEHSKVSIQIKLDNEEILQTIAVGGHPSRIFSEKATIEITKPYQYVKLFFIEHMENTETRQIGKVLLRRKDVLPINGRDVAIPVQGSPLVRATISSILGEICLNLEPKPSNNDIMILKVLDYTAPIPAASRRLSTSSTSSTSSISPPPLLFQGRVHLIVCFTAYGELIGTMSKITLFDRRSLDTVEVNARQYAEKLSNIRTQHNFPDAVPGPSYSQKDFGESNHVRLNIKIYSDPNYDENSYVGFVRIPLDPETFMPLEKSPGANWYEIKSKMTISQNTTIIQQPSAASSTNNLSTSQYDALDNIPSTSTINTTTTTINTHHNNSISEKVGDLRIRFWYSVEHILALNHYQPLFKVLMSSLETNPYDITLASFIQHLPIDLGHMARPLMKIFLKYNIFTDFFRLVCTQYVSTSNEISTLFRNQSMASKMMYEVMKFVGGEYIIATLKPVIDLVYAERKRCEIDPTKLKPGENLEENTRNFAIYAELAFARVCESSSQCPPTLKSVLVVLRDVVNQRYPNRADIGRLAVSSFIVMRFFAAAVLNPTQYGLKKKAPEPDVGRTLVLISKILQRLANCVVTNHPLITKEAWLSSVLERFFDDSHRLEMVEFFDAISMQNYQSSQTTLPIRKQEIVKSGHMVEKRGGSGRRKSIKDLISTKRRLVTLTNKELSWQKEKKDSQGEVEQKGVIPLSDITSVTQISESKSSFRVATPHQEVLFQAGSNVDMTDWMILLITHQRRHLFFHNRSFAKTKNPHNIDIEKELETLHSLLFEHIEQIIGWKEAVEVLNAESDVGLSNNDKFPHIIFAKTKSIQERQNLRESLLKVLNDTLAAIQSIEQIHQSALSLAITMQNLQSFKSDKLGLSGLSDNENYLLMRGRDRHPKSKIVPPT